MRKKRVPLRTKLIAAFISLALFIVMIMFAASNLLLENSFRSYVHNKHVALGQTIADNLSQQYENGRWDQAGVGAVCNLATQQGMLIEVSDNDGRILRDPGGHHGNIHNDHNGPQEKSTTDTIETFDIVKNGEIIGTVSLIYNAPFFYNEQDSDFLRTLNIISLSTALIASIVSIILASWLAVQISRPIVKITAAASEIAEGNYQYKIQPQTDTNEIAILIDAFNRLSDSLENQKHLRKRFTTDLSHELRTPLSLLQSHIEAMIDGIWQATPERLASLNSEINRLNTLVGRLERLNEIENDSFHIQPLSFDIKEFIESIYINFEKDFIDKSLTFELACDAFTIYVDRDNFSQLIINILSNAVKYTPDGGFIKVSCEQLPESFRLVVQDSGIGIAAADLPFVFERFYRVDKSRSSATGGRGIGLSIVKSVVDAHNGTVRVLSEVGKGTQIIVEIPQQKL